MSSQKAFGIPRSISTSEAIAIIKSVHDALGVNLGTSSTRDQRNRFLESAVAVVHFGHSRFNPSGGDRNWCIKDAGGGRPQSDDVIVRCDTRDFWDIIPSAGADGYYFNRNAENHGALPAGQNVYPPRASALPSDGSPSPRPTPTPTPTSTSTPGPAPFPTPTSTSNPSPAPAPTSNPGVTMNIGVVVPSMGGKVVFPDGSECRGTRCQRDFNTEIGIQIQAIPDAGYRFDRWTIDGFCGETNPNPLVRVNYPINCGATFVPVYDGGGSGGGDSLDPEPSEQI